MKSRKIFFVMAGGGHDTDVHYHETIKNKRNIDEVAKFLDSGEVEQLKQVFHNRPFAIWGATPGPSNIRNWERMESGDYAMVYRQGKVILGSEIAMKVKNPALAKYLWGEDKGGKTWEYIYFLINDVAVNVKQGDLNRYLEYRDTYHPQGFMAIDQGKADKLLSTYGDLISLLEKLQDGKELEEIEVEKNKVFEEITEEKIKKAPTVHDEMQWRLIRLGNRSSLDVWVPAADQGRQYQGQKFRDLVIKEFNEAIDVPLYVKNIDTVWKLGHSIKSAFEIEHSTSIYSGILRLSDLRSLAPNSNYPLFIVADRERKSKVFDQLRRPTFSNDYLGLDKVVKFLSYDKIRDVDEKFKDKDLGFDISWLNKAAEAVG